MSDFDPAEAWAVLERREDTRPHGAPPPPNTMFRPLVEAADRFVAEATDQNRIFTGVETLDREMRGIGGGHLCVLVGYAHSGKTQVLLHWLRHNSDKRIALFIPDEPASLVLTKLTSVSEGVSAVDLERRVADGDESAVELLRRTATETFPNLAVFDKPLLPNSMERGWEEVCDAWGDAPELVVVDYVDLLQVGDTPQSKFDFLKSFGSRHEVPMIVVHQTSRSAGAEGRAMTISSGNFGGEQHATFMVGVRRKRSAIVAELAEQQQRAERGSEAAHERISDLEMMLRIHQYTLTMNLVKNKRPGGGLMPDTDFELDLDCGRIYPLEPSDLPGQYLQHLQ